MPKEFRTEEEAKTYRNQEQLKNNLCFLIAPKGGCKMWAVVVYPFNR